MALLRLQTEHFRNLSGINVSFSPQFNALWGENGSGKTSVLEAIGYLGLGRSFRTHRHQAVVTHGQERFTVFGEIESRSHGQDLNRAGFSRDVAGKETRLRLNGNTLKQLSTLASLLPVSVIDPGGFDIIAGGPGKRRQFMDWAVFHVEPSFATLWQQCQKATSQRNQILRNGTIDESLLKVWDQQFADLARQISKLRESVFQEFKVCFEALIDEVETEWSRQLSLQFFPGWDTAVELEDLLRERRSQELKMGHTLYGPNRADLRLKYQGKPVGEVFSRGQQKSLVILLKIAQARMLSARGRQVTFLLDDINAELDRNHREMLLKELVKLRSQVFITSIESLAPDEWDFGDAGEEPHVKMFHVEHGQIREQ